MKGDLIFMIKIISKKEYDTLNEIIEKQDEQIVELIKLTKDAQSQFSELVTNYCELVELIDQNLEKLPSEVVDVIHKIRKLNNGES